MELRVSATIEPFCPTICGPGLADHCTLDAACGVSLTEADGCNANGHGAQCRYCDAPSAEPHYGRVCDSAEERLAYELQDVAATMAEPVDARENVTTTLTLTLSRAFEISFSGADEAVTSRLPEALAELLCPHGQVAPVANCTREHALACSPASPSSVHGETCYVRVKHDSNATALPPVAPHALEPPSRRLSETGVSLNGTATSANDTTASVDATPAETFTCRDECYHGSDGDCDDGGAGSEYSLCAACSDCTDCGARPMAVCPQPPPPSPSPPPPVCGERFCITAGHAYCEPINHTSSPGAGTCVWDGAGRHDNNEHCLIETTAPSEISAVYYQVETHYDFLAVAYPSNGTYSAYNERRRSGVDAFNSAAGLGYAPAGTRLRWQADHSITSGGFIVCFAPPTPPTTTTFELTWTTENATAMASHLASIDATLLGSDLSALTAVAGCGETCYYASDNDCDDGGVGSEYSICELGTDCIDCGARGLPSLLSVAGVSDASLRRLSGMSVNADSIEASLGAELRRVSMRTEMSLTTGNQAAADARAAADCDLYNDAGTTMGAAITNTLGLSIGGATQADEDEAVVQIISTVNYAAEHHDAPAWTAEVTTDVTDADTAISCSIAQQAVGPLVAEPEAINLISTAFTVSGTVSDFDEDRKTGIAQVFADEAGVDLSAVEIGVAAGSVVVTATISVPAASASSTASLLQTGVLASPGAMESALASAGVTGLTVAAITPPRVTAAPSPPPAPRPMVGGYDQESNLVAPEESGGAMVMMAGAALGAACVFCTLVVFVRRHFRRSHLKAVEDQKRQTRLTRLRATRAPGAAAGRDTYGGLDGPRDSFARVEALHKDGGSTERGRTSAADPNAPAAASASSSAPLLDWSEIELQSFLGAGRLGRVYRSRWQGAGVAVRRLDPSVRSVYTTAALKQEVERVSELHNPHLLHTLALVLENDRHATALAGSEGAAGLMMPYTPRSLAHKLKESTETPLLVSHPVLSCSIAQQVAQALAFLHSHDVPHGCLWPPNVMLTHRREKGGAASKPRSSTAAATLGVTSVIHVQLADFGRPRQVVEHLVGMELRRAKREGDAAASDDHQLPFTAPELLKVRAGVEWGAPADIWALGCMLARMGSTRPLVLGADGIRTHRAAEPSPRKGKAPAASPPSKPPPLAQALGGGSVADFFALPKPAPPKPPGAIDEALKQDSIANFFSLKSQEALSVQEESKKRSPLQCMHDAMKAGDALPPPIVALAEKCVRTKPEKRPTAEYMVRSLHHQRELLKKESDHNERVSSITSQAVPQSRASRMSSATTMIAPRSLPAPQSYVSTSTASMFGLLSRMHADEAARMHADEAARAETADKAAAAETAAATPKPKNVLDAALKQDSIANFFGIATSPPEDAAASSSGSPLSQRQPVLPSQRGARNAVGQQLSQRAGGPQLSQRAGGQQLSQRAGAPRRAVQPRGGSVLASNVGTHRERMQQGLNVESGDIGSGVRVKI